MKNPKTITPEDVKDTCMMLESYYSQKKLSSKYGDEEVIWDVKIKATEEYLEKAKITNPEYFI